METPRPTDAEQRPPHDTVSRACPRVARAYQTNLVPFPNTCHSAALLPGAVCSVPPLHTLQAGGGRGIRTPERVSPLTVFKTAGINHSPIPPASLLDRKSTRLNSSHLGISYAVFC